MIVWKKALRCLSVAEWRWEYVIIEMECDVATLVGPGVGKCRVPSVRVVRIHPYRVEGHDLDPQLGATDGALAAYQRSGGGAAGRGDHDRSSRAWYGRHNFTSLADGDVVSWYDHGTRWREGETVRPHRWDPDPRTQCAAGIHCFRTRLEAERYHL